MAPKPKRKAGRPKGTTKLQPDEATLQNIRGLGRIQCTFEEAAAVLGVHVDTFSDFLRAQEKAREAFEWGRNEGCASLRRTQMKMAENIPTMAIWCGKQYLGQTDKVDNYNHNHEQAIDELE